MQTAPHDGVGRRRNTVTQVPREGVQVDIVNVVASVTLKHGFDLGSITRAFPTAEYRPEQFPGLVFRLKRPKTAILIFTTGKMVCTGAKSVRMARRAVHQVVRELKAKGILIRGRPEITIQNVVASVVLGGKVDLEKAVYSLERIMYEPAQFPAAVYRMDEPKVVVLIFSAGKLVVAGAKTEAQVYEVVVNLQRRFEEEGLISYE